MRIHVVEAKDLMKKDISVLGKGKSDPYAIVSVGAQTFRTETIDSTVNPKWDFWCEVCSLFLVCLGICLIKMFGFPADDSCVLFFRLFRIPCVLND